LAEGHLAVAHIQIYSGDAAKGLDTIDTYMRLDPHYPEVVLQFVAEARFSLGRFDEAVAALKERLARNPDSPTAYALLAACYGHLGRIEESRAAWAELMRITPDFSIERRRRILPFKNPEMFEHRIEGCARRVSPYSARCRGHGVLVYSTRLGGCRFMARCVTCRDAAILLQLEDKRTSREL